MNSFLIFILTVIILSYGLDVLVSLLNLQNLRPTVPEEMREFYDAEKYRHSQEYLTVQTRFGLMEKSFFTVLTIAFICVGGFNWVDHWIRTADFGEIGSGLLFMGALGVGSRIISLPFSLYDTFQIEAKFGFNKMTLKTFAMDLIKGLILSVVIGGPILAAILWFFTATGDQAWIYAWISVSILQLLILFIAPTFIMPLFNKFIPLADGSLKKKIEDFAQSQNFELQGIFTMDGSKRSSKANAFFTGFGKFKRIVLFDTLIQKHTEEELVAILAHEIGHFKRKHIHKQVVVGTLAMGGLFYLLSLFINHPGLFEAFQMDRVSVYASLVFISFLYSPISRIVSMITHALSRKYEYEADAYACSTYGYPEVLIQALKKLSADNLSNLTPHPIKVFLDYTHPPLLKRIEAIKMLRNVTGSANFSRPGLANS